MSALDRTGPEAPRRPVTWREALDRLEQHADRAEQMIRGLSDDGPEPWAPPADLGPIPDEFVPRARQLLERQQRLMAAIPAALAGNRQHQQVTTRVSNATQAPTPSVYLDVSA
ncbi:hypothetical protein ACFQ0K_15120 [Nocardioides caeni]|uniref:Uncharacterized protein n=1 Tax=Nocardioides caeni TaxID=574700 RepID=A0A4S8NDQ4_9ACTN|nr:hypothetical protein [Nocardioides caeni]THV14690.1 hypothetical protein E9934_08525 [Nocardioides caeni]